MDKPLPVGRALRILSGVAIMVVAFATVLLDRVERSWREKRQS